jgi:hypothetical protein
MDIINRINPMIASLENTLGECVTALNDGVIDVQLVANTIGTVQQALSKLRPLISTLIEIEDDQSLALFSIKDDAIELLLSLDSTQHSYQPRPHDENIDLIHAILEWFHEPQPTDSNNVVMFPVKGSVTP